MDISKIVPSIKINSPIQLLKSIVGFNEIKENESSKIPVKIGLCSGFSLEGFPLKISPEENLILSSKDKAITLLHLKNLEFVEILPSPSAFQLLSDGDHFEISEDQIPTNLGLKRLLKSLSDQFEQLYGFQLKSSVLEDGSLTEGTERHQFQEFLIYLKELLVLISEEELGGQALKSLKMLQIFKSTERYTVSKSKDEMQIGINFKQKFSNDFKAGLKSAFESKL